MAPLRVEAVRTRMETMTVRVETKLLEDERGLRGKKSPIG
jgi:hypothetical protein